MAFETDRYSYNVNASFNMGLKPGQLLLASRGFFSRPGPSVMFGRGIRKSHGLELTELQRFGSAPCTPILWTY